MNSIRDLKRKYSIAYKSQYPHQIGVGRRSKTPSAGPESGKGNSVLDTFPEQTRNVDKTKAERQTLRRTSHDDEAYPTRPVVRVASLPDLPGVQVPEVNPKKMQAMPHSPREFDLSCPDVRPRTPETSSMWTRSGFPVPERTSSSTSTTARTAPQSMDQLVMTTDRRVPNFSMNTVSEPSSPARTNMTNMDEPSFDRSSGEQSNYSQDTSATSVDVSLYPLQTKGPDNSDAQDLRPLTGDDPRSFDLVEPMQPERGGEVGVYALEKQADLLMSNEHLSAIFGNSKLLLKFTGFLNSHRPNSIPLLIYYLDALKAIRAIKYANAIAEALEPIRGCDFTKESVRPSINRALEERASKAFDVLVKEDLPAYITYTWIQVVSTSIQRRISGTLAPHLREASEGLAEVFCLTDPSRPDNPIVFASEEFARTTQYGMTYAIGRNCRFLQGPKTIKSAVRRLAEACQAGRESNEVFVNYRRDGSPFMNLLMTAPLLDSRGEVRYYIGAQVDVSGLLKSCSELPALAELMDKQMYGSEAGPRKTTDEFRELCEMFNGAELQTVRKAGGKMHRQYADDSDADSTHSVQQRRVLLQDDTQEVLDEQLERMKNSIPSAVQERVNGKLAGVYQHYLLIRPAPSLRILFSSPSLRVPGILQSPFLNRIGGSPRVRSDLASALAEGRSVTAKVRWLARPDESGEGESRPRWIHCTPLLGHSGAVGVWMVVLVDEEGSREMIGAGRRFRTAPPVAPTVNGSSRDWATHGYERDGGRSDQGRRLLNTYDAEYARRGGGSEKAASTRSASAVGARENTQAHAQHTRPGHDHRPVSPVSERGHSSGSQGSAATGTRSGPYGTPRQGLPQRIGSTSSKDFALR